MKFQLSSQYGVLEEVRDNIPHTGIDFAMPEGTKLRSLFDGVVEQIYDGSGKIGEGVKIITDDGKHLIYGHMSDIDVKVGEKISAGEVIGESGNTGLSTGPHLHFGIKDENGNFIDPTQYAEKLSDISGATVNGIPDLSIFGFIKDKLTGGIKEQAAETTQEVIWGILEGIGNFILDTSGFIALVGCGLLIIMKVVGFDKGYKWAGMLFTANALIKYLGSGIQ